MNAIGAMFPLIHTINICVEAYIVGHQTYILIIVHDGCGRHGMTVKSVDIVDEKCCKCETNAHKHDDDERHNTDRRGTMAMMTMRA